MSTTTTNYNLVKPEYSDDADIADINGNMDAIDTQMKANADAIASNTSSLSTLSTTVSGHTTSISSLSTNKMDKTNLSPRGSHTVASYSEFITYINGIISGMSDGETRIECIQFGFTESIFGGSPNIFIIYRFNSAFQSAESLTQLVRGTRWQGTWSWTKASQSSVTVS